jgi:CarboxypepD_reg-like domain
MPIFSCLYSNFIPTQQLTRKLAHQQTTSSTQLYAIIVGLFSLGTVTNTWAYDRQPTVAEVVSMGDQVFTQEHVLIQQERITNYSKNVVQAQLLDSMTKAPLIGATILIQGTTMGVLTDAQGKFTLTIPDNLLTSFITLEVRYFGYSNFNINIDLNDLPITNVIFYIPPSLPRYEGGIIALKPKKWWQFWK